MSDNKLIYVFLIAGWITRALVANPWIQRTNLAWRATPIRWPNTGMATQVRVLPNCICIRIYRTRNPYIIRVV